MKVIKKVMSRQVQFGGEEHSGWLPPGASLPQPVPVRLAIVDLKIVEEADGDVLLVCESHNTDDNWDDWFENIDDAIAAAKELYGIDESEWK